MLKQIDQISSAGSQERPNEDISGSAGNWAWIIDGATPAFKPPVMDALSDARWLAQTADEFFRKNAPASCNGTDLVRSFALEAQASYLNRAPQRSGEPENWPVAALLLMLQENDTLHFWSLKDATAYILLQDKSFKIINDVSAERKSEMKAAGDLMQQTCSRPNDVIKTAAFQEWISRIREDYKDRKDYSFFGLFPESASFLHYETVRIVSDATIMLMSDGFSALCDMYQDMPPEHFVEIAVEKGLDYCLERIRAIEREVDPEGRKFPRFKQSDDATALLLRCFL